MTVTEDQQDREDNQDLLVHQEPWVCQDQGDHKAKEDHEVSQEDREALVALDDQVCLDHPDPEENQVQMASPDPQVHACTSTLALYFPVCLSVFIFRMIWASFKNQCTKVA